MIRILPFGRNARAQGWGIPLATTVTRILCCSAVSRINGPAPRGVYGTPMGGGCCCARAVAVTNRAIANAGQAVGQRVCDIINLARCYHATFLGLPPFPLVSEEIRVTCGPTGSACDDGVEQDRQGTKPCGGSHRFATGHHPVLGPHLVVPAALQETNHHVACNRILRSKVSGQKQSSAGGVSPSTKEEIRCACQLRLWSTCL